MDIAADNVMNIGMRCLVENIGLVEAERFISIIMQEKFDYTKWQREYFDRMTSEQLHEEAVSYAKKHPYKGNAKIIVRGNE